MGQAHARNRRAEASDIEDLIALELRTIRESYASFLGKAAVEAFIGSGAVERFVRETGGQALVVTLDHEVVGYAVGTGDHIDQLMIDVRSHRRGLGTQLLAHLESELFKDQDAPKQGWEVGDAYRDEAHGVDMVKLRKEAR